MRSIKPTKIYSEANMRIIEDLLKDRSINYGWVMVVVVFVLSGLAFGSLASISVFLNPISLDFVGREVPLLLLIQLLLCLQLCLVLFGE